MSNSTASMTQSKLPRALLVGAALVATVALLVVLPPAWRAAVILGIVEGVTEFLPISSTGHLLITSRLLGFESPLGSTFEIFIQLGAVLAVVGYYIRDLLQQARDVTRDANVRRFWIGVVVAFLPAALLGLLFQDFIKAVLLDSPTIIAWALIIGGVVFIAIERLPRRPATTEDLKGMSLKQALAVGLIQILAFVPGVSRSGASIIGGMLAGLDRRTATAFSFYLSIPTLGAATMYDLLQNLDKLTPEVLGQLAVGTIVSLVVAWLSIGWLLRYVATNNFVPFGIYRIIAGAVILALVAGGYL
jgi:undecaprenyl-diphosphatase